MSLCLTEYPGKDIDALLHLVISLKVKREKGALLIEKLTALKNCYHVEDSGEYIVVKACKDADVDRFIQQSCQIIDQFNFTEVNVDAELIEARMCPPQEVNDKSCCRVSDTFTIHKKLDENVGPHDLVIDHGKSFGSGQHPSTRLAVIAMEYLAEQAEGLPAAILDVGCGSGILSIIAAKLGGKKIMGIDLDDEAINAAKQNVGLNNLSERIFCQKVNLDEFTGKFNLIVANLSPAVLIGLIPLMVSRLEKGGRIILAGMQTGQLDNVKEALASNGIENSMKTFNNGSWQAILA